MMSIFKGGSCHNLSLKSISWGGLLFTYTQPKKQSVSSPDQTLSVEVYTKDNHNNAVLLQVITQGSSQLLDVHPLRLHFPFEAHKLITCSLQLTNKTDEHVAFMLSTDGEGIERWLHPFAKMPLSGIVSSKSAYTLTVTMKELSDLPQKQNFNLILRSTISLDRYIYTFTHDSDCDKIFKDAIEKGNPLHEVKLEAVFSIQGQTPAKVSFLLSVFFQGKSTNINDIKHKRVKDQYNAIINDDDPTVKIRLLSLFPLYFPDMWFGPVILHPYIELNALPKKISNFYLLIRLCQWKYKRLNMGMLFSCR